MAVSPAPGAWDSVRQLIGEQSLTVGPFLADQLLHAPRHLLFVLARYKFAARLLPVGAPSDVLELGCGEGFGARLLAEAGHRVLGVDADTSAIESARRAFGTANLWFEPADFLGQAFGTFRSVVSLDVIEHIAPDLEDAFLQTVTANLADDGFCVIGTPNEHASPYASPQSQAGHINLYTPERLAAAVGRYFDNAFVFGMNDEVVHTGFYPMCHYVFVLGTGKRARPVDRIRRLT